MTIMKIEQLNAYLLIFYTVNARAEEKEYRIIFSMNSGVVNRLHKDTA